jgi:hypothetical protein
MNARAGKGVSATADSMFYPAFFLGEFPDASSALRSVGITGAVADFCICGADDSFDAPVAYEATLIDSMIAARTMLVIVPQRPAVLRISAGPSPGIVLCGDEDSRVSSSSAFLKFG